MDNLTLNQKEISKALLPKLLFTLKETAYILSVSEKSVRRFLERGLLKTNPSLRTKLITRESIEVFAKMTL
jgi:hypothetical protein